MNPARIFNIISIFSARATAHLVRQALPYPVAVILDLEDSLWDVFNPEHTSSLKAGGRECLIRIAEQFPGIFETGQVGVRLNRLNSAEFGSDLEALSQVSRLVELGTLVVTKIESGQDLQETLAAFSKHKLRWKSIVPIVETCAGVANIAGIAREAAQMGIETIIYGHYDYSLDAGHWPFLSYDDPAVWEIITPLIAAVEREKLSFGNAPLMDLYDNALFVRAFEELRHRCTRPFGMMTIGLQHTRLSAQLLAGEPYPEPPAPLREAHYTPDERRAMAFSTCDSFEAHMREGKGFALDAGTGRFISPHQYLAAKHFLEAQ